MARREAGARPRLQGQERALLPPEAAESWAVVETLSHCRPAPNGVENKFYNLLSRLPPDSSSCLSLAEPNWKPEIKREVSLGVSFLGLSLAVGLLGAQKTDRARGPEDSRVYENREETQLATVNQSLAQGPAHGGHSRKIQVSLK